MLTYTSLLAFSATFFTLATAAPAQTRTTNVVHRITAGSTTFNAGLHFEPQNVVASPGDWIEFHFLPKNHSIVQSSFDKPCEPLADGVFSGFNFATAEGEAENVFRFQVQSAEPFWYYCSQGEHCQKGMSGVINQNFGSAEKTLANYKEAAKGTVTVQPSEDRTEFSGGEVLVNTFQG